MRIENVSLYVSEASGRLFDVGKVLIILRYQCRSGVFYSSDLLCLNGWFVSVVASVNLLHLFDLKSGRRDLNSRPLAPQAKSNYFPDRPCSSKPCYISYFIVL